MLTRRLVDADRPDELGEARDLAELEKRLFGRSIEPVRLSRYVLIEKLAAGGFGSVYLAYDPELDRKVAIKILHGRGGDPDSRLAARDALLREAQALVGGFDEEAMTLGAEVGHEADILSRHEVRPPVRVSRSGRCRRRNAGAPRRGRGCGAVSPDACPGAAGNRR